MGLTNRGILDVVNLAFYAPVLPISLFIVVRQGFSRKAGWIYLVVLSILRIIGALTGLIAINNPTQSLIECSTITYGIGVTPLLLAFLGILQRVNDAMSMPKLSTRMFHVMNIPIMIGLVFSILGGLDEFNANVDTQNTGIRYLKIATTIYAVMLLILSGIAVLLVMSSVSVKASDKKLLFIAIVSLPFFGVRVSYSVLTSFDRNSVYFKSNSNSTQAVVAQAIMSVAMEFIIMTLYIVGGFSIIKTASQVQLQKTMSAGSDQPVGYGAAAQAEPNYQYPVAPIDYTGHQTEYPSTAYTGGYPTCIAY
jgi:uncharacterized membrane protein (DUF485 family)